MLIKTISIPAYVAIFVIGVACMFTIFTFAISFALMILDAMAILLSGLIGLCAVKRCCDGKALSANKMIPYCVLQFVFCADVVASIIVYRKARKNPAND